MTALLTLLLGFTLTIHAGDIGCPWASLDVRPKPKSQWVLSFAAPESVYCGLVEAKTSDAARHKFLSGDCLACDIGVDCEMVSYPADGTQLWVLAYRYGEDAGSELKVNVEVNLK